MIALLRKLTLERSAGQPVRCPRFRLTVLPEALARAPALVSETLCPERSYSPATADQMRLRLRYWDRIPGRSIALVRARESSSRPRPATPVTTRPARLSNCFSSRNAGDRRKKPHPSAKGRDQFV